MPKPGTVPADVGPAVEELLAQARLGGRVSYVVADARTGAVLDARAPNLRLPPASVTKAVTALYALDTLGPEYRFRTAFVATGPVVEGVVQGDLVLTGAGDPVLDTDDLSEMVAALKAKGVTGVTGAFRVYAGALPYSRSIDPRQPAHVGYNPAISGLNLNFNRVHFQWQRAGKSWQVSMDARSGTLRPAVTVSRMAVVNRNLPTYTYSEAQGGVDEWTVASAALGNGGSRWLPVRRPDLYTGEVTQVIARAQGITLPAPQIATAPVLGGTTLVSHDSASLATIIRLMLKYSTNLTAEIIGLTATKARGGATDSLAASAEVMNGWVQARIGTDSPQFLDHSGLSDHSRVSAADLVKLLVSVGPGSRLHELMKQIDPLDSLGKPLTAPGFQLQAKTGSLNFVSTLAGFVTGPALPAAGAVSANPPAEGRPQPAPGAQPPADGATPVETPAGTAQAETAQAATAQAQSSQTSTALAFAILSGDLDRRATIAPEDMERPEGARPWARRARWLQHQLIHRWVAQHGAGNGA